ncbi:MAG: permease-like cell division protein FtsX [Gammaproteobacteria bacterium]|nr:permease-like cell division protein FtsX [Gammaproteobacteria bacterium]
MIGARWLREHLDVLVETLQRLRQDWLEQLLSVAVIGISLALPAAAYLAVENSRSVAESWDGSPRISLYLDAGLSVEKARALTGKIDEMERVDGARFISQSEGLASLEQRMQISDVIGFLEKNPLPHVIEVTPVKTGGDTLAEELLAELGQMAGVERARLDLAWVKRFFALLELAQRLVLVLAAALGVAVLLVVGNTVRLAISSRRTEIEVCKLVGASDAYVSRPLLYYGAMQGFLGAVLAWLLLLLTGGLLSARVERLAQLYESSFQLNGLGFQDGLVLLLGGTLLGLAGAALAVARELRAIQPA